MKIEYQVSNFFLLVKRKSRVEHLKKNDESELDVESNDLMIWLTKILLDQSVRIDIDHV